MSRLSNNPDFEEEIVLDEVYKASDDYGTIYTIKVSNISDVIRPRGEKISFYDITILDNNTYEEIMNTNMCVAEFPTGHHVDDYVFIAPKSEIVSYKMDVYEIDYAYEYLPLNKVIMLNSLKIDCERQHEFMRTVKNAAAVDIEC